MTEQKVTPTKEEVSLLDYLIFLLKWKKLLFGMTAGFFAAAVALAFLLPKKYAGETKILLPLQGSQSISAQVLSQLGTLGVPGSFPSGERRSADLYAGLLKSSALLDRIIDRFNLMSVYGETCRDDVRQKLQKAISIQGMKKSGLLVITVEDGSRERAAAMANAAVEELKKLTATIAVTEASQRRVFFEEQLRGAREGLAHAEEAMRGYQERTGAVEIKEQARAVIDAIANLRAQVAAKEVEIRVLKGYAKPRNPDLQRAQEQLQGLKEQLAKLEAGGDGKPNALISARSVPGTGIGYVRKMRDLKYAETLHELMTKQYEMARLDEARDAAVIQVVDLATPPEKATKPRKGFLIAVSTLLGLFFSCCTALALEYREKVRLDPSQRIRLEKLAAYAAVSLRKKG